MTATPAKRSGSARRLDDPASYRLEEQIGRLRQPNPTGRVQDVGRGESVVNPSNCVTTGVLAEQIDEGGQVVVGDILPFGDVLWAGAIGGACCCCNAGRNLAQIFPRLEGEGLDFLPQLELALLRPDGGHLGQGVTLDHPSMFAHPASDDRCAAPGLHGRSMSAIGLSLFASCGG